MLFNDNRLLFVDRRHIESAENVELNMNPPDKAGAALVSTEEWELTGSRPLGVLRWKDEFRFYYRLGGREGPCSFAVATSSDGVNWQKPDLGVVEFSGSKRNNLIDLGGCYPAEFCAFVDPSAPEEARFKLVAHGGDDPGMYAMYSADGLSFKRCEGHLLKFILDCSNTSFYDDRIGRYVILTRGWDRNKPIPPMDGSRTVIRGETDDLSAPLPHDENAPDQWPVSPKWKDVGDGRLRRINKELPSVIYCDEQDPPVADIYQPAAVHYLRETYLAFPTLYYWYPWPPEGFVNDGVLDLQFAASQDGIDWHRDFRGSYVRNDLPDGPCSKLMHMLWGMALHGSVISQYYRGGGRTHGQGRIAGDVRLEPPKREPELGAPLAYRLEQRLDGFVSADSAYTGGTMVTAPFVLESDSLKLNIDTSASGVAHAALLDENDRVVPGFGLDDCDRIQGNDTQWPVSWKGSDDLSGLRGRKVKLALKSRNTKLFAVYP